MHVIADAGYGVDVTFLFGNGEEGDICVGIGGETLYGCQTNRTAGGKEYLHVRLFRACYGPGAHGFVYSAENIGAEREEPDDEKGAGSAVARSVIPVKRNEREGDENSHNEAGEAWCREGHEDKEQGINEKGKAGNGQRRGATSGQAEQQHEGKEQCSRPPQGVSLYRDGLEKFAACGDAKSVCLSQSLKSGKSNSGNGHEGGDPGCLVLPGLLEHVVLHRLICAHPCQAWACGCVSGNNFS